MKPLAKTTQELLDDAGLRSLEVWVRRFSRSVAEGIERNENGSKPFPGLPEVAYRSIHQPDDELFELATEVREIARRVCDADELNRWLAIGCLVDGLVRAEQREAKRSTPKQTHEISGFWRRKLASQILEVQREQGIGREKAAARVIPEFQKLDGAPILKVSPNSLIRLLERDGLLGGDKST